MEAAESRSWRKDDGKKRKKKKLHVEMECVKDSKDKIAPFVGYFPSGFNPMKRRRFNPRIRVFRNEKFPSRVQLVISPKGYKIDFVGSSHSGEAAAAQVCTYSLGIFDKEKQSLKIVPFAANKIFRLDPRLRGESEDSKEDLPAEKSVANVRDLTNLYGTKAAKRQLRKWDSMHQSNRDAGASKYAEDMVEEIEVNRGSLDAANAYVSNIPPHDVNATSPENAYPLDKIISNGEWNHLLDIFELIQSNDASSAFQYCQKNDYSSFVCNRLSKLDQIQDLDEKRKIAGVLSYINYLLKFKNLAVRALKSGPIFQNATRMHHGIPLSLFKKFDKIFGNSGSVAGGLLDERRDLLIRHILVLTLFADGFETEISDVAKDLKMHSVDLRPHYVILGCNVSSSKGLMTVTLPIPLKLPQLRNRIRKKKRKVPHMS